jgi:subtilisin family serine protease
MAHRSRFQKRFGSFRSMFVLALVAILALVLGPSAQTQDQASLQFPDFKALKAGEPISLNFKPSTAGIPDNLSPLLKMSAAALMSLGSEPHASSMQAGAPTSIVMNVEFDSAASRQRLRLPGVSVLTAVDRFVDLFAPLNREGTNADPGVMQALVSAPGFVWVESIGAAAAPPPPQFRLGAPTRAIPEQIVHGGYAGLTGKGVIVAIIDSGTDFRHPDFINFDASGRPTSRLLYFWDTMTNSFDSSGLGSKAPYSYPNGSSIGTLYTRQQLTAELASGSKRIPATDEGGHGTGTSGIAAGNGNGSKGAHLGVAPEADIIGVRIAGGSMAMEHSWLLNAAVAWIDAVAKTEGRPVVISCSFGGHSGAHDGSSIEERELDARFPANAPGRAIVFSAGNERTRGLHAQTAYDGGNQPARLLWQSEKPTVLNLFLRSQGGGFVDPDHLRADRLVLSGNGQRQEFAYPQGKPQIKGNPVNHDVEISLQVQAGVVGFTIWSDTGEPFAIDAYLPGGGKFHPAIERAGEIVGSPGTAAAAITIGSYDWNDQFNQQGKMATLSDPCTGSPMQIGNLSCYSSIGYSRDGSIKPDIVSPGEVYYAPYPRHPDGKGVHPEEWHVDTSGYYMQMNGTSSAAPYTAGIIALMLQKKPDMTTGEIKSLLELNATQDSYTGTAPNPGWGYGKLDIAAVRAVLNAIH